MESSTIANNTSRCDALLKLEMRHWVEDGWRWLHDGWRLKTRHFLASFGKKLSPPSRINVERRRYVFSSPPALWTLQLVHGAIKLPAQVSFVEEHFVGGIPGWQAEAARLCLGCEALAELFRRTWASLRGSGGRIDSFKDLVSGEPEISERISYLLSHTSINRRIKTLRISEPHFVLPRQQLLPISS